MRFSATFKYIWWAVTIIAFGALLYLRKDTILSGSPQAFDTVLIAILAALLLLPFFSELSLLGVTLKQQLEETKKEIKQDVREQLYSLRTDIQNVVNVTNRMSSQIFVGTPAPPPDNQLPTLEQQIRPILEEFRRELGLAAQPQPVQVLTPSSDTVYAFSGRYQIERELTRIWNDRFLKKDVDRPRFTNVGRIVEDLVRAEVIPPALGRSIREVYSIGSAAIHGEEPSHEKISFLREVVPSLIGTLRAIA